MSTEKLGFPGDFILDYFFIINHRGESINITNSVVNLNVYESIHSSHLTGDFTFVDSTNIIRANDLGFGQERVSISLRTPEFEDSVINNESSNWRVVAVLEDETLGPATRKMKMSFTTKEFVKDKQVRISKTFEDTYAEMVVSVLTDENYLNTKKDVIVEPTANIHKFCVPDMHPFEFINTIAPSCQAKDRNNVGYLFYESLDSTLHFRSYGSLTQPGAAEQDSSELMSYTLGKAANISDGSIKSKLGAIETFKPMTHHNDIVNFNKGFYGSKLIDFDIYKKTHKTTEYSYFDAYETIPHLDSTEGLPYSKTPDMGGKTLSDYKDYAQFMAYHTTADANTLTYSTSTIQQAHAEENSWDNNRVHIKVPGRPGINAGSMILIVITDMTISKGDITPTAENLYSGKYLAENIQHSFVFGAPVKAHQMSITAVRDSIEQPLEFEKDINEQPQDDPLITRLQPTN